jgi:hypothetical protein
MRRLPIAALALLVAACGADEPAPPPPNPVEARIAAPRDAAKEAERAMQASAERMNAAADSAK